MDGSTDYEFLNDWWEKRYSTLLSRHAKLEKALRIIDEDIIGLHRFDSDEYCRVCGNDFERLCEGCVAHCALQDDCDLK